MTPSSVSHATFVIERTYDAPVARVFNAFADPETKRRWFSGPPEWQTVESSLDFRVGGREVDRGGPVGGAVHSFYGTYQDIVPNERIVFTYDMLTDDVRISVSLSTLELRPEGTGTRLVYTEQDVFLDGYEDAGAREYGMGEALNALGAELARQAAPA